MNLAEKPERFSRHDNAFGFLRLFFASLVIVSHVPEIVDLSARRELLHQLTGSITFGSFAVWGFFVISGYLITGSWLNRTSALSYIFKRVARIYPGFIAASIVCLVIVAPLSGASFNGTFLQIFSTSAFNMTILARPMVEHPFAGQNYSDPGSGLNGAMWTIQYEFACYLLVILFSVMGILRHRRIVLTVAACLLCVASLPAETMPAWVSHERVFPGSPDQLLLLPGMFLAGSAFYLYRHALRFSIVSVVLAAMAFILSLTSNYSATLGYALFGGYLIFAVAKGSARTWVGKINEQTDISYGVYLYAWPVEQMLIRYMGAESLLLLGTVTWCIAATAGWLSWKLVEQPILAWAQRKGPIPR